MNAQEERRALNGGGTSSSSSLEETWNSLQRSSSVLQKQANGGKKRDGGAKPSVGAEASYGLQRLGSFRVPSFNLPRVPQSSQQQPRAHSQQRKESSPERRKPLSAWGRLLRKLGFDGGKKVHAARVDWLNYDAKNYSMNFEKDREMHHSSETQEMPKISGPGAREIVTVLLQRSTSHGRNSASVLIPKPVAKNKVTTMPLWQRRAVTAPSSLDLSLYRTSSKLKGRRENSM
ncbi:hypothetical protein R1sor_001802 [Riccia sorocarpa]|uniref:Uncharacterized protein n=1 Tax=Riccia sorocarpa TaxID=122646 RepID=A0ABD3H058_9MARC